MATFRKQAELAETVMKEGLIVERTLRGYRVMANGAYLPGYSNSHGTPFGVIRYFKRRTNVTDAAYNLPEGEKFRNILRYEYRKSASGAYQSSPL